MNSNYVTFEQLTEVEQELANKITHNAIMGVNYDNKLIEAVRFKDGNKIVYNCYMSCRNQKNVNLEECYSFDDYEVEHPCDWNKIETYCNNYLTNYGRE